MKFILPIVILFSTSVRAQRSEKELRDSINYYERIMGTIGHRYMDSLRKTPEYQEALDRSLKLRAKTDSYGAFVLFMDAVHADFEKFNRSIANSGYQPLSGPLIRFGFGMSFKSGRIITDFNFISASVTEKSEKTTGTPAQSAVIKSNFYNGGELDFGYDLIKSNRFNFYPYLGLSTRTADLDFEARTQFNPTYSDITNLVQNDVSASASSNRLGYQAGIGLEIVTSPSKYSGGGIVFVKGGINKPIGNEKYKIKGIVYDPGISYGNWIITIGVKFFGRR